MNMNYYMDHIKEELDGALEYVNTALELKGSKPSWSKMFLEMSAAELQHAEYLNKMCEENYETVRNAYKMVPSGIRAKYDDISACYKSMSEEIKLLHAEYNK